MDERTILDCAATKLAVVAADERDAGARQVLNLGHTVGHAIETVTHYTRYRHGEAVGLGLLAALRLSGAEDLRAQVRELLLARDLPVTLDGALVDVEAVIAATARDKKRVAANVPFVLVRAPGEVEYGCEADAADVRAAVAELTPMTRASYRLEVMHGVNLDQLGHRDPLLYGTLTLPELERQIERAASAMDLSVRFFQTNHEGAFVEHLHSLRGNTDAILLNPGSWTHYAWAIRDALEIAGVPALEIHLSDIENREQWRRLSVIRDLCFATISGRGPDGYPQALTQLRAHLDQGEAR